MMGGTVEDLIRSLEDENERLTKELEQAHQDIKDFERLALVWKKSYQELEFNYSVQLGNKDQVIEDLETDLEWWKQHYEDRD